jgi:hypothetical protein
VSMPFDPDVIDDTPSVVVELDGLRAENGAVADRWRVAARGRVA